MLSPCLAAIGTKTAARLQCREPGAVLGFDLVEPGLAVVFQVHFVDQHRDLPDAQQVQEIPVPARILLHAFMRVDQQQRRFGVRRARDHVLEELLVPRRVDDDVLPPLGLEPDLGRVDCDVLVALGLQRVHQVGPLERNAAALGDLPQLLELAFRQRAGVVEQPADERGFSVVHMADDDDFELFGWSRGLAVGRNHCENCSSLAAARGGWSHVAVAPQFFKGIFAFLVLGAAGALRGSGVAQFLDNLAHGCRVGLDGQRAGRAAQAAVTLARSRWQNRAV